MAAINYPPEIDQLVDCQQPFLIGVRHHSAALARVMDQLLEDYQPTAVLLELPPDFSQWIEWLGKENLETPVALAGTAAGLSGLSFYPFADFSPELAAVRWAARNKVPVHCIDLPVGQRPAEEPATATGASSETETDREQAVGLLETIFRQTQTNDVGSLWEKLVETPAAGSDPESIRRAALLFGLALRANDGVAALRDRARENYMRQCIQEIDSRSVAIVGSYHAAALLPEPLMWSAPDEPISESTGEITTAMIPYSFSQLDERSGYPAGIRDPWWHQKVFEARDVAALDALVADMAVGVCRALREEGHAAGSADGKEVVRMARDLARLRGFHAAGRGEFLESTQMCLTQGQLLGRGKAVASAMQQVLVGQRNGTLPEGIPRSGLGPDVENTLKTLNLPGPDSLGQAEKRLRLDPLRSKLDRARVVVLERLRACEVPYGQPEAGQSAAIESLTQVWDVQWEHSTHAMLELSAARGATLEQATLGCLTSLHAPEDDSTETASCSHSLSQIERAAVCGIPVLVERGLIEIVGVFTQTASLSELTRAMQLIDRIERGHIPGLPLDSASAHPPFVEKFELPSGVETAPLLQAAISRVPGLFGSEDVADVDALLDLVLWYQQQDAEHTDEETHHLVLEAGRLLWLLRDMSETGSPMMQGAAIAALMLLDEVSDEAFGDTLGSWVDAATSATARRELTLRLTGALITALPGLAADVSYLDSFETRTAQLSDRDFLKRLPAIRGAFEKIVPQTREQILDGLLQRLPEDETERLTEIADPALASRRFAADNAGREAVKGLLPDLDLSAELNAADAPVEKRSLESAGQQISLGDRWRLMIGIRRQDDMNAETARAARALDELYGRTESRGRRRDQHSQSPRGGKEAPFPNTREWAEELESLFGGDVREEVLGKAAANGRVGALAALDENSVTPSIDLLEQILSLRGSLAEGHMEQLRRLAKRIVDQLVQQLAIRVRPALNGFSIARPTRRRSPRLDLNRTIRANLHTVHESENGERQIFPEKLFFKTQAKRSMDWHLIFVVDVSGSMEPSIIYSAMMSAIFNALPAVSVRFLAFSTEVIDFSDHVDDPLSLLLEVQIGGGTSISKGLNAARQQIKIPQRTMVVLLTDFMEGSAVSSLLSEVSALADTGAKLMGLAALDDAGVPRFNKGIAERVAACGMPVAALSPQQLARWVGEQMT